MNWICVQNGAREHYAIPRALARMGRLEMLFTEVWAGPVLRRLAFGPFRAIAGRYHRELEEGERSVVRSPWSVVSSRWPEVVSWNCSTLLRNARFSLSTLHSAQINPHGRFIRDGRWFSERVRDYLARRGTDLRAKVVFSYDTTAMELFQWAKERGAICVLGQMDPGRVETDLVRAEEQRWPGWAVGARGGGQKQDHETTDHTTTDRGQREEVGANGLEDYFQRREAEWRLADRIIVNSRWSFDALVQQGVPANKLAVVPLCFEEESRGQKSVVSGQCTVSGKLKSNIKDQTSEVSGLRSQVSVPVSSSVVRGPTSDLRPPTSGNLRVLWLGQVILRKGIQYLMEAAKLLQDEPVQFDVVGPVRISEAVMKSAPPNMTFHGRINRDQTAEWYARSDVFVLPTLSDGFALTQLEAMAHGLPVIATPNCGEVVSDGVDGFIVPVRDAGALANAIRRYLRLPDLLREQALAAKEKSRQFTLDKLAVNLVEFEDEIVGTAA